MFCNLSLEESIKGVKDLGFENMEFNPKCIQFEAKESVRRVASLIEFCDLKCLSVHCASIYVENLDQIGNAIHYGETSIDIATELSSPVLVVHSYVSENFNPNVRAVALEKIFLKLLDYAEDRNVKLALENLSFYSQGFGKTLSEIEEILNAIDSERIWITLDYCHAENINQTTNFFSRFKLKIKNVHLSGFRHSALKENLSSLKLFLKKLKSIQYDGPLTIEISSKYGAQEILETKAAVELTLAQLD